MSKPYVIQKNILINKFTIFYNSKMQTISIVRSRSYHTTKAVVPLQASHCWPITMMLQRKGKTLNFTLIQRPFEPDNSYQRYGQLKIH